jgi:hypothetical protein
VLIDISLQAYPDPTPMGCIRRTRRGVWLGMSRVFDDTGVVRRPYRTLAAPAVYAALVAAALATRRR